VPSKPHEPQPSTRDLEQLGGYFPELTKEQKEGIAIAAYICRMYGEGEVWAEAIESYGEQQRARHWMMRKRITP
jgi:hypothetical protein